MKPLQTYPLKISLLLLFVVLAGYGLFENSLPDALSKDELVPIVEQSLDEAEELYQSSYDEFVTNSNNLYDDISTLQLTGSNHNHIFTQIDEYSFWGISLYRGSNRLAWKGYNLTPVPIPILSSNQPLRVSLLKRNNVVYLFGQKTFELEGQTYHLLTSRKMEMTSNLPFANQVEFHLSEQSELSGSFPVTFNFFNPLPNNILYRNLSTETSDSVGVVFASLNDAEGFTSLQKRDIGKWRLSFQLGIFLLLFIIAVLTSQLEINITIRIIQITLILISWILFYQFDLITYWRELGFNLTDENQQNTFVRLGTYLLNSFYLLLLFITAFRFNHNIKTDQSNQFHFRTILLSVFFGAFSVYLLLFFILSTQGILINSSIPLLDLELAPDPLSFFLYLTSSIFFTATSGIIVTVGYFLYKKEHDKSTFIAISALFSFILFYYLTDLFLIPESLFNWIFVLSLSLFSVLLWIIHSVHKHTYYFREISGFRKLMIGVLLASVSVYVVIWSSSNDRIDRELLDRSEAFANEDINYTREILSSLLIELEGNLLFLTENDIVERTPIVQAQFQRAIQNIIRQNWRNHSFEVQLLNPNGELISDYSTNLDSPGWRSIVDIELMVESYRGQQIRRVTNQPIIWTRPANLGEDYVSFYRGWIPIYDESEINSIIAWIFAATYLERPDYNKPLRAVLAAATSEDWKESYYIAEFMDEHVVRSAMQGIYNNQPEYNRLPDREVDIAANDSLAFITNITAQGSFREILLQTENQRIVKASTPIPGINHHIFSYFRLQIVMVFFGLFIFSILAMFGNESFSLFGQSKKFKQRLLDGLTLATILFLTVLIFSTQFAVNKQNEINVERDLITKLNSLAESMRDEIDLFDGQNQSTNLNRFATPLNVDAALYSGADVVDSTTPQIFQQHVMPRSMPYPVYDFLYNRERRNYITTEQIGDETLLIGYRALLDDENSPVGAIAIPTFVQSPVYREQLLETTSYLFGVYLVIFGLFIIGTVFFTNQLTKPLQIIQNGLSKISRGDLKTQVSVTSRDEIGSLAKAYNEMVQQLDETQKELLKAEREAAWKEMAQQVAHEIKNPLTPMKLNLQHLQRQLAEHPDDVLKLKPLIERTSANIIEQIESLNKIASDFSKFSKPVQQSLEPTDLNKLISSISELYKHDENIALTILQPKKALIILAVEDELRRAMINLVKNGIEAHQTANSSIKIELKRKSLNALISISDSGSGITQEDREKIFVPNFSTKSSGTGLGLAITKKIIEAHNGEIWFTSAENEGTTFYISIPLHH